MQPASNFPQGFATVHTAEVSTQVLRTFSGGLISGFGEVTWPARSPGHPLPEYLLWGYVKSEVYETHPANIADSEFWSVFRESPRKCCNVLRQPFHRDSRSVLNNMVVIYTVSYSSND